MRPLRSVCRAAVLLAVFGLQSAAIRAAGSAEENGIKVKIGHLRSLPDASRGAATQELARAILQLPAGTDRLNLAYTLATISTEGDFGHETLQRVADTLAASVRDEGALAPALRDGAYRELAALARYEGVQVSLDSPLYSAAVAEFGALEQVQNRADFTLNDLAGKPWRLSELRGKTVLVNFFATWCPPCRKEMPDLQALSDQFKDQGLIVLSISAEAAGKVRSFIAAHQYHYPILLDPEGRVGTQFRIKGIPQSLIYDREGKIVARAIDLRTRGQFLEMLRAAGLE